MKDCLIFDLDGTISDPIEGIGDALNYALAASGYETLSSSEVGQYVGPPLDKIFKEITGEEDPDRIQFFVGKYRERFSDSGIAKNVVYSGMDDVIAALAAADIRLGVCTSKRQDFAVEILRQFQLLPFFKFVSGGDVGISKGTQLKALLSDGMTNPRAIMIGDRAVDILAAKSNGLRSVGVSWGYGSREELVKAGAELVAERPQDLLMLMNSQGTELSALQS